MGLKERLISFRIFDIISVVWGLFCIVTTAGRMKPATYLIAFYCDLFNTDRYSPMLLGLILFLPVFLLMKFLKVKYDPNN